MGIFDELLAAGAVVLDGAMATELEKRGVDTANALWSATALVTDPGAVLAVHTSYFAAGAQLATTNSYQASVPAFEALGMFARRAHELIATSARLAGRARDDWLQAHPGQGPLLVAGSIGPYGAYLADGSEYRGDYTLTPEGYRDFHRPRIEALVSGGVDVFAVETQPRLDEARAIAELLAAESPDAAAWVSFQLRTPQELADGTALAEAARWAENQDNVVAVGMNCVPPALVGPALGTLAEHTRKPLLCYPNSGESYDPGGRRWLPVPPGHRFPRLVPDWLDRGARLIGGCCRSTPADIAEVARQLSPRPASSAGLPRPPRPHTESPGPPSH